VNRPPVPGEPGEPGDRHELDDHVVPSDAELEATLAVEHPPLPAHGLFEFYDRLRERVLHAVEERGGKFGETAAEALLLVPDVFLLLVRLTLDPEVPGGARTLIGGTLAYFVLPVDLLPEAFLGPAGYLEDVVLAAAVLAQAFEGELEPYAKRHWTGSHELPHALDRVLAGAERMLGERLLGRVRGLLGGRGISLPAEPKARPDGDQARQSSQPGRSNDPTP
jgi:uncharacterized membrane protein YkvA (DUF1232 family)